MEGTGGVSMQALRGWGARRGGRGVLAAEAPPQAGAVRMRRHASGDAAVACQAHAGASQPQATLALQAPT